MAERTQGGVEAHAQSSEQLAARLHAAIRAAGRRAPPRRTALTTVLTRRGRQVACRMGQSIQLKWFAT